MKITKGFTKLICLIFKYKPKHDRTLHILKKTQNNYNTITSAKLSAKEIRLAQVVHFFKV